jgi:hypothetical protein
MNFVSLDKVRERLAGSVAIVGSAPSCLDNEKGFIDSHDVVIRINNYKLIGGTGARTDILYSFFGSSVRKSVEELKSDGVKLCICKCPDSKFIESRWHEKHGKPEGIDFRPLYKRRKRWWFTDTFIPSTELFLEKFNLLDNHIPTTGFSCIYDVLKLGIRPYITGFDFFTTKLHNVDELWRPGSLDDPIGHRPQKELEWLRQNQYRMTVDKILYSLINKDSIRNI